MKMNSFPSTPKVVGEGSIEGKGEQETLTLRRKNKGVCKDRMFLGKNKDSD